MKKSYLKNGIAGMVSVVILLTLAPQLYTAYHASGQISPATNGGVSTGPGVGLVSQNITEPSQNATSSNITQLATISSLPLGSVDPITAASNGPANVDDDDDDDNKDDDDDDNDNDNDDNDDDDDDDDDDGGSRRGGAFASAGGSVAIAG